MTSDESGPKFLEERVTYLECLPRWLQEGFEGNWCVIQGSKVWCGKTYEEVLEHGYKTHGLSGFMVKRIEAIQTIHRI
ncbi:MAG: hypothetical protein AB7G11_02290 [Phycisphaerales bacterium]